MREKHFSSQYISLLANSRWLWCWFLFKSDLMSCCRLSIRFENSKSAVRPLYQSANIIIQHPLNLITPYLDRRRSYWGLPPATAGNCPSRWCLRRWPSNDLMETAQHSKAMSLKKLDQARPSYKLGTNNATNYN